MSKKKKYAIFFSAEVLTEAESEEEAIELAWHDIITDTENIVKLKKSTQIDGNISKDKSCYDCYHFRDSSGVYEGRDYCKLGHTLTLCDDFIDKNDKKGRALYNLRITANNLQRKIKEEVNNIENYVEKLEKLDAEDGENG